MNCDRVQEILSAFLDREENADETGDALSHLYSCIGCQRFFDASVRLRDEAKRDRYPFPVELDKMVLASQQGKSWTNLSGYRRRVPSYVFSAVVVLLMAVSFGIGFMVQESAHQKEMKAILQAPPSEVVYGIPERIVYPALNHSTKGGVR